METTQIREQVRHADSKKYLLNIFSIHNYETISNVIPAPLRHALSSLQFVPDGTEVKLKAAAEIHNKKSVAAAKKKAETTSHTNAAPTGLEAMQTPASTPASGTSIPISTVSIQPRKRQRRGNVSSDGQQRQNELVPAQSTPIPSHATTFAQGSARDLAVQHVPPIAQYAWQALSSLPPSHVPGHAETFMQGGAGDPIMQQVPPVASHVRQHSLPFYNQPPGMQNVYNYPIHHQYHISSQALPSTLQYENHGRPGEPQFTNYPPQDISQQLYPNPNTPSVYFNYS